jgi:nitrous oxide reductase
MDAGQLAAPFVPGGAVLSAAITGLGGLKSKGAASTAAASPNAVVVGGSTGSVSGGSSSGNFSNMEALAAKGDSGAMQLLATKEMQEMNQSFNLQYLELQQNMQNENRKFTTLSNVMKTKHDTAKATINNVR